MEAGNVRDGFIRWWNIEFLVLLHFTAFGKGIKADFDSARGEALKRLWIFNSSVGKTSGTTKWENKLCNLL